jgi:preprotein translocase subunit YajC
VDPFAVAVIWSLLPTVVVSVVFYFVMRSVLRMDRTERKVHAKIEAQERAKRGLAPATARAPGADR